MIPLERILERVEAVPALSPAAVEALTALDDDGHDAAEIERIVRLDPSLTATFLRLANAACFGSSGQVDTLLSAITRLGSRRVRHVITAAALARVIPPYIPGYQMDAQAFWGHCAATALLTEGIYRELGREEPGVAFVAALLHDIGRLALGAFVEEVGEELTAKLEESDRSFEELEREVIGVDHASLGLRIATAWRLPEAICNACAEHHEPDRAPEEHRAMIEIIHVADLMAYTMGYGLDAGGLRHQVDTAAAERIELSDAQLAAVVRQTRKQIEELVELEPTGA